MSSTDLQTHITKLVRIGIALSAERDLDTLLEMIVDEARRFTRADGGTLYVGSEDRLYLDWKILHNKTMGTRMGGTSHVKVEASVFPPVPLHVDELLNTANVCTYVANAGVPVNIPNVYETHGFDFSGTRRYDGGTGYRSQSMLVVPMRNHEDDIIGVLQLINAHDSETDAVIAFSEEHEDLILSLASQAAVGITNAKLIQDLENLFDAFIRTTATAIDEKSPYTAGHVRRVADLTMRIVEAANACAEGDLADVTFSAEEMNELRIAAWMHDVGKMTTPEYVVDKAKKLETIYDRIQTLQTRWQLLAREAEVEALRKKLDLLGADGGDQRLRTIDDECAQRKTELAEEIAFIEQCNMGGEYMEDADIARLEEIAKRTYGVNGERVPQLTENELENLCIRKGTLTEAERLVINNHATVSIKMLSQLPFSKGLSHVPEYAGGHHEKLNGEGYPQGLTADELPLQSRILAVADVFEALTAPDRPYRPPMKLSQALKILGFMVKDGELDSRVVDLLTESGVVASYAQDELGKDQIDI